MSVSGISDPGPLAQVREGMRVVDTSGDEVGVVKDVRMGDKEAVTDSGESTQDVGLFSGTEDTGLSEQARHRLARTGFVQISKSGIMSGSVYAAGDEVARVEDDVVHLSADKDALLES